MNILFFSHELGMNVHILVHIAKEESRGFRVHVESPFRVAVFPDVSMYLYTCDTVDQNIILHSDSVIKIP